VTRSHNLTVTLKREIHSPINSHVTATDSCDGGIRVKPLPVERGQSSLTLTYTTPDSDLTYTYSSFFSLWQDDRIIKQPAPSTD